MQFPLYTIINYNPFEILVIVTRICQWQAMQIGNTPTMTIIPEMTLIIKLRKSVNIINYWYDMKIRNYNFCFNR